MMPCIHINHKKWYSTYQFVVYPLFSLKITIKSLANHEEYPVDTIGMEGSFERRVKAEGNLRENMGVNYELVSGIPLFMVDINSGHHLVQFDV